MSESSIIALQKQIDTGALSTNASLILKYIQQFDTQSEGIDMIMLEAHCQLKQSTVTSRVSYLEDLGVIYSKGTRTIENYNGDKFTYSLFFAEYDPLKQEINRDKRELMKFKRAVKGLMKNFPNRIDDSLMEKLKNTLTIQGNLFGDEN